VLGMRSVKTMSHSLTALDEENVEDNIKTKGWLQPRLKKEQQQSLPLQLTIWLITEIKPL